ncbi:ATP-dependent acyl-CoA ligase [Ramlibacter henchirensis]|uniref:ATP-dependent acyl-CoA ligase n=1 Tax=Ramlibacter henchirensis TaxID=204072 RepID=A0A4Z0C1F4_9BURK|nr:AMP-binding protein [Ramlibacter henchirensis]TFZ05447.1 ATP-dependent acyl-CoA ligase [Ramlibacter henchirensis]
MNADQIQMPPVGDETLRDRMDRRAAEDPGFVFLKFKGRDYSFGEIDAQVNRLANALLSEGLRPGDRVALMLPSHPEHIVAILALAKVGLVRVPINTAFKGPSLQHPFQAFEPRALIADRSFADVLEPVLATAGVEKLFWRGADDDAFAAMLQHPDASPPRVAPAADDIIALTPSSGTTGAPKGVNKSDRTLRAGPMGTQRLTGAQPGDVFLLWESLHHGAGVAVVIAAILQKITLAMVEKFSASQFWDQCREAGVTHIHYLGGVLPMLLKQPPRANDREHKVRIAWGGGCPPEVWDAFADRFGVEMREGYGLSEMITFVTVNPSGPKFSIGRPLSYFDVKLADDEGREVPAGQPGEILVRSHEPGLQFLGYFRNEEASRTAMRGEWFCTGDLARRDDQGFLYFAGRKKDTVRRRGINISAWEVERVIGEHPAIAECALVGVPSELGDDELKLFVRVADGRQLEPEQLVEWCRPRMPAFQVPRFIEFISEFPKTPTQRIRKNELSRSVQGVWDAEGARSETIKRSAS